jgi:molybdate transport system ATP-binding protein
MRKTGMTMLAAIPFASGFAIDAFMHGLVDRLKRRGLRLGGVVQHNDAICDDRCMAMSLEDVATGRRFPISQDLGAGASGCHLDAAGLAAAAAAFSDALAGCADLVIVNRFGKQEAAGEGLRQEIASALMAGLPLLIAVRSDFLPAWRAFAGEDWLELSPDAEAVERWARSVTSVAA